MDAIRACHGPLESPICGFADVLCQRIVLPRFSTWNCNVKSIACALLRTARLVFEASPATRTERRLHMFAARHGHIASKSIVAEIFGEEDITPTMA